MTFGSLFAGIGGMDLGLERAGMTCSWQVEIDPFCQRVLAKHWPDVPRHDDVRTFPDGDLDRWRVDLICGGFPCQDISNAGRRAGIEGSRSRLWFEFGRVVRVLRPRFVLVENSAALLGRGMGAVLQDLAQCGYDAEWDCFPAAAFGALHIRNRVFLLAYPNGERAEGRGDRSLGRLECEEVAQEADFARSRGGDGGRSSLPTNVHDSLRRRHRASEETVFAGRGSIELSDWWASEPDVGRVAHGVPDGLDRRRVLGNAVVPQVAEWIGRRIIGHASGGQAAP